ncbi:HAMP domain-containing protein [Haloarcula laminariae]|uniref:HAMP domain-containing protein n=1 Tax=Haloarcula laminariae TaxID=2961577 RepID=UPI0021C75AF1|nr:HAMP domain-containing protein [Halomicroarcula laminariae]
MSAEETPTDADTDDVSGILPAFLARSFLAKFVVALLLVTVVILGVSANTYAQTSSQLTADTQTEYVSVANSSATQVAEWRQSRRDTTRRLGQFEVIRSGTQSERQAFLEAEAERLPNDVIKVQVVNRSSTTVTASSDTTRVGESQLSREAPWRNEELDYGEDGVYIAEATNALQTSLVSFVTPIETDDGDDLVLVMQTDLNALASDLPQPSEGVYSQVIDSQGRIVAGTRGQTSLGANAGSLQQYDESSDGADQSFVQRGLDGEKGFLEPGEVKSSLSGEYVVAYHPVADEEWVVATHVPVSTAYALQNTIQNNLLVLSGVVFLGIGVIGVVFGRGTVSALNRLTENAERLEAGNLDTDLEVTRRDEFGQLTASFASMRDALRDRIQEAESARKEAEVSRQEALAMTDYLQEKAEDYSEVMQQCANGDLTQRMETDNENEAMDRIAEEFNDMLGELEKTTGQLKTFSEEVAESSEIVLTNTENVRQSAERVTASVERINADATDQEARLEELAGDLDVVIERLHSLKGNPHVDINDELDQFENVAAVLDEATGQSQSIRTEAESAGETAKQQADELDEVSERADRLKRYAKPLGGILDRFETAAEHEFVFSGGPSQPVQDDGDD